MCFFTFYCEYTTPARFSTQTGGNTGVGPGVPFPSNSRLRVSICMDKLEYNALPHSAWSSVEILTNEHKFLEIAYYFTVIQDQLLFFSVTIKIRDRKKIMCCCETQ